MAEEGYVKVKAGKTGMGLKRMKEQKIAKRLQDFNVLVQTSDLVNQIGNTSYIIGDESCFLDNSTMRISQISFPQIDKKGHVRPKTFNTADIHFEQFMFNEGLGEEFLRAAVLGTTAEFTGSSAPAAAAKEGGGPFFRVNDAAIEDRLEGGGGGADPVVEETKEQKEAREKAEAQAKDAAIKAEWAKKKQAVAQAKASGKTKLNGPMKGKLREQALLRFLEEMYPNCTDERTKHPLVNSVPYDPKSEVYLAVHQVPNNANRRILLMTGSVKAVLDHCKQVSASPLIIQEERKAVDVVISEVDAKGKKKSKNQMKKERKAAEIAAKKSAKAEERQAKDDARAMAKAVKGHGLCGAGAVTFNDDGETASATITGDTKDSFAEEAARLEGEGCKMMGFAYCEVDAKKVPDAKAFKDYETVLKKCGKELKWVGMTGLYCDVFKGMETVAADAAKHGTNFLLLSEAAPNFLANVAKRCGILHNEKIDKVLADKDLKDLSAGMIMGSAERRVVGFSVPLVDRNAFYIKVIKVIQDMGKSVAAFSNQDIGALKAASVQGLAVVKKSAKPEVLKVANVTLLDDNIGSYVKGMSYVVSVIGKNPLCMCQ